ncbi:hypothetical protein GCM10009839_16220 [Catenulispora yoronensis]|uniref:Transposase n=1 Tax=Catenulispora yoronensis TaxID=450799 RepID=A0ABN2TU17_9ACTN
MRRRRRARLTAAAPGHSRGGLTCKVRLAADQRCRPLAFLLTLGQAADSPRFVAVLEQVKVRGPIGRPRTRPGAVAAEQYRDRNTVERCINKIKAWCGLATRYDKTPDSYMAGLQLRGSLIWIRSLRPAT